MREDLVEDRGLQPRSSPCKGDVLADELIPRNLAGTVGLEPTSIRVTGGCSAVELHAIGAPGWFRATVALVFSQPLYL